MLIPWVLAVALATGAAPPPDPVPASRAVDQKPVPEPAPIPNPEPKPEPKPEPTDPSILKGSLKLPPPIVIDPATEDDVGIEVVARFDPVPAHVRDIEWSAAYVGGKPRKIRPQGGPSVLLGYPEPGEQVIVTASALVEADDGQLVLTRHATTTVVLRPGSSPRATRAAHTPIPAATRNLWVNFVLDRATANDEAKALATSKRIREAIAPFGSFHDYDAHSPKLTSRGLEVSGALPAVIVQQLTTGPSGAMTGRVLGVPTAIPLSGDQAADETRVLDTIGRIVGATP